MPLPDPNPSPAGGLPALPPADKPAGACPGCGAAGVSVGWYAAPGPGRVYAVAVPAGGSDPGGVTAYHCPGCGRGWDERRAG